MLQPFDEAWGLFPTHAKPLHSARTLAAQHQLAHAHSPPRQRPGSAPRARSPARPAPSRPASAVPRASLAPGRPRRRKAPSRPQWDDSTLISKGFEHIVRETKLGGLGFQGRAPSMHQAQPGYGAPRAAPDHRAAPTMPPDITQPRGRKARLVRDAQYASNLLRMQSGPPASGGGGAGVGAGALRSHSAGHRPPSAGHQRGMRVPAGGGMRPRMLYDEDEQAMDQAAAEEEAQYYEMLRQARERPPAGYGEVRIGPFDRAPDSISRPDSAPPPGRQARAAGGVARAPRAPSPLLVQMEEVAAQSDEEQRRKRLQRLSEDKERRLGRSPGGEAAAAEDKGRRVEKKTEEELADEWLAQRPWVVEARVQQRKKQLAAAVLVQALERGRQMRKTCADFGARLLARRLARLEANKAPLQQPAEVPSRVKKVFKLWDKDGGGQLDGAELEKALRALGVEADCEKTQKVMKRYDVDGDGAISKAELTDMLKADIVEMSLDMNQEEIDILIDATMKQVSAGADKITMDQYMTYAEANRDKFQAEMTVNVKRRLIGAH